MMRKAQDRAGLHGGIGGLQGIKGLAGIGSTLASNKFVRAAVRVEVGERKYGMIMVASRRQNSFAVVGRSSLISN